MHVHVVSLDTQIDLGAAVRNVEFEYGGAVGHATLARNLHPLGDELRGLEEVGSRQVDYPIAVDGHRQNAGQGRLWGNFGASVAIVASGGDVESVARRPASEQWVV